MMDGDEGQVIGLKNTACIKNYTNDSNLHLRLTMYPPRTLLKQG